MDEFGDGLESDSSFDSGMDLGGSESFDSFDTSDISLTETEPLSESFDEAPLEDFSSGGEDLSFDETPALEDSFSDTAELSFDEAAPLDDFSSDTEDLSLDEAPALEDYSSDTAELSLDDAEPLDDYSSDTEELPFDDESPLDDPDMVPNDISEEMDTLDAVEEDPSAMLDKAPEEDMSYFEDESLEDASTDETTDLPEELPLDETVPETEEIPESSDDFEELPFDETDSESTEFTESDEIPESADAFDETVPETDEVTEPTDSIEELPFDEAETAPEVAETPDVPEESEYLPSEEMTETEVVEPTEDNSGVETYDFETAPETLDDQNPETVGEFAPSENPYSESWEQFSEEVNEGDSQQADWDSLQEVPFAGEEATEGVVEDNPYESVEPSYEDSTNIESPEAVTDVPEDVPESVEETAEVSEVEEPAERVYNDFEQSVMENNPEFYESGEFLEQGVNKHGFEGTCGETTQANTLNKLLGTNEFTEDKVLDVALDNNLCFSEGDPESCGGTTTEQFMDLYDKMNEQLDGAISTELYEYDDALDVEEVAKQLEDGNVVNVAVDSNALWGYTDYVDEMGVPVDDVVSDHWITVTGVERNDLGEIEGFNILDSGGGENYVSAEKYHDICFGTDEHKVLDPTTIVVSKTEDVDG